MPVADAPIETRSLPADPESVREEPTKDAVSLLRGYLLSLPRETRQDFFTALGHSLLQDDTGLFRTLLSQFTDAMGNAPSPTRSKRAEAFARLRANPLHEEIWANIEKERRIERERFDQEQE